MPDNGGIFNSHDGTEISQVPFFILLRSIKCTKKGSKWLFILPLMFLEKQRLETVMKKKRTSREK